MHGHRQYIPIRVLETPEYPCDDIGKEGFRRQAPDYSAQLAVKVKRLVSMVLYGLTYLVMLVLHVFVALVSSTTDNRGKRGDNNYYSALLILNIVICVLSAICWCILVQNTSTYVGTIDRVFTNVQTNVLVEDWTETPDDAN